MKIIATVTDAAGVVNAGASIEARSAIIEIPDESLPPILREYLENRKWVEEGQRTIPPSNRCTYEYLTFSILDEAHQ